MQRIVFFAVIMTISFNAVVRGGEMTIESGKTRTHLIELFTSEGCSSCPPAEAWLSKLKDEPRLWRDFVPLAFHVDYWDRLGWRDPFAARQWTARQYDYSSRWNSSSVYTPGFVLNGREWRDHRIPNTARDDAGVLKITLANNDKVSATFEPVASSERAYDVHVARLGFDLNINVKAGENGGRKLLHDFVVLSLTDAPLNSGKAELRLAESTVKTTGPREAIAAWITERGKIEPIQAVGGWR
jgi:hypothetical protein